MIPPRELLKPGYEHIESNKPDAESSFITEPVKYSTCPSSEMATEEQADERTCRQRSNLRRNRCLIAQSTHGAPRTCHQSNCSMRGKEEGELRTIFTRYDASSRDRPPHARFSQYWRRGGSIHGGWWRRGLWRGAGGRGRGRAERASGGSKGTEST
jgi:hypothetical protein